MTNKHFKAILAKNCIVRELSDYTKDKEYLNINYILCQLKEIENYIGEGNQPSIENIFKNNTNINRQFTI